MSIDQEAFTAAYIETALWSAFDDPDSFDDVSDDTRSQMVKDCAEFYTAMENAIHCEGGPTGPDGSSQAGMAGHDFWLTRNGHGAGFWDGDWPEPYGDILDKQAKSFGEVELYIGDDRRVYS